MVLEQSVVIKPYVYQVPCIDIVKKTLLTKDEALYVMAMGLGKTITSAFVVEDRLREGKRGIYLCHETYILKRVQGEYVKVLGEGFNFKTFYGSEAEGNKDWTADQADMVFASFQSLNNWHNQWFLAFDRDHFDFMVIDESHHAQAPSYKEVIDYFQCKKIAMTATPDRMDLKDIREIFGEEVFDLPLEVGIANGWLANVEYHVLSDGINNAKLKKICQDVLGHGRRVSIKQINETIFINERDKSQRDVVAEFSKIKELSGDKKTLLFCERTIHADNLLPHFERSGVMHSKKTWKENQTVFDAFEEGKLQYVASVNKFNEGKHVPGVEVIVFLRATDSLTVFWQQLGRALAKIGNKTKVIVLDFVANLERLIMIRDMMLRIKKIQGEPVEGPIKPPIDTDTFNVTGEGFEFIFSDELVDVMKIIEALRKGYYETWEEAGKAAIVLGISTSIEYKANYKKDLRLPSAPDVIYPDFPGFAIFLGRKQKKFYQTWQEAGKAAVALGLKTQPLYKKGYHQDEQLPSNPNVTYSDFPGFYVFFGGKPNNYYKTWEEASVVAIGANINSYKEYLERCEKIDPRLPQYPVNLYDDFPGWAIYLGKEIAPGGWYSLNELYKKLRIGPETLFKFVDKFREKGWVKEYWRSNQYAECCHPDLVKILFTHFTIYPAPDPGWRTAGALMRELEIIVERTIKDFASTFRKDHPGWFKMCHGKKGKPGEHYHPDLCAKIIAFAKSQKITEEWKTAKTMSRELKGISEKRIKEFALPYVEKDESLCKKFKAARGVFYHPSLVLIIKKHFQPYEDAPPGWMTTNKLYTVEKISSDRTIKQYVEQYREKHKEWFKFYIADEQVPAEHFHPDLVALIRKDLGNRVEAPKGKGWMTLTAFRKAGITTVEAARNFVSKYRISNPEWFADYWNKGQVREHYHPDLVQKIKDHYAKKKKE